MTELEKHKLEVDMRIVELYLILEEKIRQDLYRHERWLWLMRQKHRIYTC